MKYVDPDGKAIERNIDFRLVNALQTLYSKSETFRNSYKKLSEPRNSNGQKLYVVFIVGPGKYAGNTQSQDCDILQDANVLSFKNGEFTNDVINVGEKVQAIIISIDYERIQLKNLNLFEVLAEEVSHAEKAAEMGTDSWNERAEKENKLPYFDRKEEVRAKELVTKILAEVNNEK